MRGYWHFLLAVIPVIASLPLPVEAQEEGGSQGKVDPYYGSLSTEVPITLPRFHDLEPALKLSYSSAAGNGWAGVGWGVNGLSYLERTTPGRGAPRYDASDSYTLDGMELVPCTALGGTYCTQIQNYTRIVQDTANNRWYVHGTNGNRATYTPLLTTSKGTFRWALSSVVDPKGNTISYSYWCDGSNDCYPDTIAYNGNTVKFHSELRPDPLSYATGGGSLATTRYRLKSIDVRVGASRARAYRLTYVSSADTSNSLLVSVQQYGRDATVDASGSVTGGTALPAMSFGWQAGGSALPPAVGGQLHAGGFGGYDAYTKLTGDFNGDGRTDLAWAYSGDSGLHAYVSLARSDGTFAPATGGQLYSGGFGGYDAYAKLVGDFNADGKTDLAWAYSGGSGLHAYVALSRGDGTFAPATGGQLHTGGFGSYTAYSKLAGDFNGDGRTDLAWSYSGDSGLHAYVALARGDGTFAPATGGQLYSGGFGTYDAYRKLVGDFNGDGRTDLAWSYSGTSGLYAYVALGRGDGTFAPAAGGQLHTGGFGSYAAYSKLVGDFNADGKTDLLWSYSGDSGVHAYVALGRGDGSFTPATGGQLHTGGFGSYDAYARLAGDFNGDGRTDLAWSYSGGSGLYAYIALGRGDGSFTPATGGQLHTGGFGSYDAYARLVGDFNGDGRSDLAWAYSGTSGLHAYASQNRAPIPDLLTSVANGIGGTTTVTYRPSSSWANTNMPSGLILQTVASVTTQDGRGNSSSTSYQYQGGLWAYRERRFLGFRKVNGVLDAAGNYTETYYYQKIGSVSKPEYTYFRNASGRIYSYSAYKYTENTTAPYTSLLTERWDFECNLDTSCRRILTQLGYDQYGNVTTTYEYGDYDVSGDERTTIRGYVPNISSYVVGLPAYENIYVGTGTGGALARQVLYEYDGATSYQVAPTRGSVTRVRRWDNRRGGYVDTSYQYDSWGNLIAETDPRGYTATTEYDAAYRVYATRKCNALGQCTSQVWDAVIAQVTSAVDLNGRVRLYAYDGLGRPTQVTHPDGSATRFSYLDLGNPSLQRIRETQPDGTVDGLWTDVYQDGLGRVYKTVKEGGLTKEIVYSDASNQKWKESLWYGPGETPRYQLFAYDGARRLRTVTNPDGSYSEIIHGNGYKATYDELRNEKVVWKDAYERVSQVREKNGAAYLYTTYHYDVLGNLVRLTDAAGNSSTYTWDSLGNKLSTCDVDSGCLSYSYDGGGLLRSQTDAKGQTLTFTYDALGRIKTKSWPDGQQFQWYYDEAGYGASKGKLTRLLYPSGSESHTWSGMGLEISSTRCVEGSCQTLQQDYDTMGRLSSLTYPDGEVVRYAYGTSGRLASVSGYVSSMAWSPAGQLTALTYANGTVSTFSYDANRQWLSSASVTNAGGTLYQASYTYDVAGRVTRMSSTTNPLSNLSYSYDGLSRLLGVSGSQGQSFAYDAVGNMTANSSLGGYGYGAADHKHAVTTAGANSYSYDDNGNMTAGAGRTLTWDYENRLASVTRNGQTTRFGYDAGGQRIFKKSLDGTSCYFGPLVEMVNGSLVKYYYAGPLLVARRGTSGTSWYHQDHLGSVRMLTNASGQKVAGYDYAAFGATVASSASVANARGYGGHVSDAETGLLYMNARYYDTELGRFISPDSVIPDPTNPQALNRYSYVYNNPVANTDPTGHAPVVAAIATVASVYLTTGASTMFYLAMTGAALTVAGYALKDPVLATIGSVMLGFAGGGPLGAAVAGLTSPLSPLDPGLKMSIGWAYTAYCWISTPGMPEDNPELGDGIRKVAEGRASNNPELVQQGIDKIAQATNTSPAEVASQVNQAYDIARQYGLAEPNVLPKQVEFWGSGAQLAYGAQVAEKSGMGLTAWQAVLLNPTGGLTGPGASALNIQWGPVGLHAVVHDADGFLFNAFGMGGGYTAFPHWDFLPKDWPVAGQWFGVSFQTVRLTTVPMLNGLH